MSAMIINRLQSTCVLSLDQRVADPRKKFYLGQLEASDPNGHKLSLTIGLARRCRAPFR